MKKIYTLISMLILALAASPLSAQNLVQNPGMETWTSDTKPANWNIAESITKESGIKHGGSFSAKHTSASSTKKIQQVIEGVVPGKTYTVSFWYFDNDNTAKTRIWSYWLNGTATLADHEAELRPTTYSENNSQWQQYEKELVAPAGATGFRFEVRVYNQDGNNGGAVYYDDFVFSSETQIKPEPTNYPTAFAGNPAGTGISLSWVDATGSQLPDGYLIYAIIGVPKNTNDLPVDGIPVENNLDVTEGYIAWNVNYGKQAHLFPVLPGGLIYFFNIYPYTNSGSNINYKTDGTAPSAMVHLNEYQVLLHETFDTDLGVMDTYDVAGAQEWTYYHLNNEDYARISGYSGAPVANEDWLISPAINTTAAMSNISLNFRSARNYEGNALQLMKSTNYSGTGNPNNASWQDITDLADWSSGTWTWVNSGNVLLAATGGSNYYFAFKYTSTTTAAATWQVDDLLVFANVTVGQAENQRSEAQVYPNPTTEKVFVETVNSSVMSLFDLTGRAVMSEQLPAGKHEVEFGSLKRGIYFIHIQQQGHTQTIKLVVK